MADTIAQLDSRLLDARQAFYEAMDAGKFDLADVAYALMDALLDERSHHPLDR